MNIFSKRNENPTGALPFLKDGNLFRSRLEVRWSIVFDLWGINYLYEEKRFDTKQGWYLPDFYLPNLKTWIEIKPTVPSKTELDKCREVSLHTTDLVILLSGKPDVQEFREGLLPCSSSLYIWSTKYSWSGVECSASNLFEIASDHEELEPILSRLIAALIVAYKYSDFIQVASDALEQMLRESSDRVRYDKQRLENDCKIIKPTETELSIVQALAGT